MHTGEEAARGGSGAFNGEAISEAIPDVER